MALSIKDPRADQLAREVARLAGESLTEAVARALEERLERLQHDRPGRRRLADELDDIARRCARLPVLDPRPPDEIIGYDEHGLPR
ncbi:MAG TPA: type II toxin-antitoxin system VapB family antitoxin [Geminicoccaceae bacterium]